MSDYYNEKIDYLISEGNSWLDEQTKLYPDCSKYIVYRVANSNDK